ncbi:MAG: hypothetical protein Dbin4_01680 [Alphaproteobacteria bacterium]|nr:hypothetical protein [Alphaproteobacteria bacterium]
MGQRPANFLLHFKGLPSVVVIPQANFSGTFDFAGKLSYPESREPKLNALKLHQKHKLHVTVWVGDHNRETAFAV